MDLSIFQAIHSLAGRLTILDWLAIFSAKYLGPLLILWVIWLLFKHQERFYNYSFAILATLLSRGLIVETIRFFYLRPRPFVVLEFVPLISHDPASSFPSGHAALYFALAGSMWLVNKKYGWWFLSAATLIGLARIVVGVHWPTDIIAGAAIGLLSVCAVHYLLPRKSELISGGQSQ